MPTRERRLHEATSSRLREIGIEVRDSVLRADLGRFDPYDHLCDTCGMPLVPVPHTLAQWRYRSWRPWWNCIVCEPELIAELLAKAVERARIDVEGREVAA
jgi:hypothetical protein